MPLTVFFVGLFFVGRWGGGRVLGVIWFVLGFFFVWGFLFVCFR